VDNPPDGGAHKVIEALKGGRVGRPGGAQQVDDAADVGGGTGENKLECRVVESRDGGVKLSGLGDLLGELVLLVAESDTEPLDRPVVSDDCAGRRGVGRDRGRWRTTSDHTLGLAAPHSCSCSNEVPGGEPEVTVDRIPSNVGVVDVPDIGNAQRTGRHVVLRRKTAVPCIHGVVWCGLGLEEVKEDPPVSVRM
jgi:hypothetical protein